ncbi:hypothetical protein PRZ48_003014 [Zasmidium cellare]|uniref:Uncharacterized protein n=1 Tax=Zasmidium cellare TaxID=395010 RepID=A0ABR0ETW4_ZASCE|nr:hypothetical protein PRZ48_003014 [Zasmidium cellare]
MSTTKKKKHYGIDLNRYLGVEFPADQIQTAYERQPSRKRSSFGFRDSLQSIMANMTVKPSSSLRRRWSSKSSSAQTTINMPFVDRTNTQRSTTTAATATSSFLPELNSTPPMPTFQKPDMATPTPNSNLEKSDMADENATPTRGGGGYIPRRPPGAVELSTLADPGDLGKDLTANHSTFRQPPTTDQRAAFRPKNKPVATVALKDRFGETPPLPDAWNKRHDKSLCVLDYRGYSYEAMVPKMKRTYPELGGRVTEEMFRKRLAQLDQNIDLTYWADAIQALDAEQARAEASAQGTNTVNQAGGQGPSTTSSGNGRTSPTLARSDSTSNGRPSSTRVRLSYYTNQFHMGFRTHYESEQ